MELDEVDALLEFMHPLKVGEILMYCRTNIPFTDSDDNILTQFTKAAKSGLVDSRVIDDGNVIQFLANERTVEYASFLLL